MPSMVEMGVQFAPLLNPTKETRRMRPKLLVLLLFAALPTLAQTSPSSQPQGTISGTVMDEHMEPFEGVTVCTYMPDAPSGSKESRGGCPAITDGAGHFRIDHLARVIFERADTDASVIGSRENCS